MNDGQTEKFYKKGSDSLCSQSQMVNVIAVAKLPSMEQQSFTTYG